MRRFITLLCLTLCWPTAQARIYHYENAEGRKVYVDSIRRVPPEFRDQMQVREERAPAAGKSLVNLPEAQKSESNLEADYKSVLKQIKSLEMPVSIENNLVIAPVKLFVGRRSVDLKLLLDTGASSTVINKHALLPLHTKFEKADHIRLADGSTVPTKRLKLDRVSIGPYQVEKFSTRVLGQKIGVPKAQGLLGMDFLSGAPYELDLERKRIIWEPTLYSELQILKADLESEIELQKRRVELGAR
ncbi:retropepsin-like aspartic protease [Pontibacterium granulatum]|uniref:retropepsin-like aspartic protease n=1 Tax=Pontibacterium granulatum TaxID=2036029 RepID=UPI002499C37A|nr:retropepsin-like aspartic protease [Pontibacterium granulatum]MDI3325427.1 retropepsin-like aspartic protease [Pontibacterium granulatum]